jgi:TRAP-type mannitol/chloroaromatic compound transport system permease small subunit
VIRDKIERVLAIVDRLSVAAAWIAMALVVGLVATVIYEVVARHFLNAPTIWSYDVSYMLNGTLFMLGGAYTLKRDGHVRIDFLMQAMPPALRHLLQAIVYLGLFAPVMALGSHFAVTKALTAYQRGTLETASAWEPVIWPFQTGLAIGMCLLVLQTVAEAVRHLLALGQPASSR